MHRTSIVIVFVCVTSAPTLASSSECDYDSAYAAGLNAMAANIPDMERHAPYQVIEREETWQVRGYDGPGSPNDVIPNAIISKATCKLKEFIVSD